MIAAYYIISASAKPISKTLKLQMFAGTSGSGADGTYVNWKLKLRDVLRDEINDGKHPYVGVFHKQGTDYIWDAVKKSGRGMFALFLESRDAAAARAAYEKSVAMRDKLNKMALEASPQTALTLVDIPEPIEADLTGENRLNTHLATDIDNSPYLAMRDS
jgi:hypothetical protein